MKKFILGVLFLVLSMALVSCSTGTPEEKVSKYLEKSLATQELQDVIEQNKALGIDLTIVADGTAIVYESTLTVDINDLGGAELVSSQLETELSSEASLAEQQNVLELIKKECSSVTALVYEFYDSEGNLLTSKTVE